MRAIYEYIKTSKQNIHQRYQRMLDKAEELSHLEYLLHELRDEHPMMGGVKMYTMLQPYYIGRDRFLSFYRDLGFCIARKRNFKRTTNSNGVIRFPNLVDAFKLTNVNQVWVSDITYYELEGRFYYITFLMDLYSRYIVGYHLSRRLLTTHTTIPAFKMAWKNYHGAIQIILHSDGGGQYYSKKFLALTNGRVINSMSKSVYENAHAERINGIIKNEYLKPWKAETYSQLLKMLDKAVDNYNNSRPHRSLKNRTPREVHYAINKKAEFLTKKKEAKKKELHLITHSEKMVNRI
jgi:transposase InsO family protein